MIARNGPPSRARVCVRVACALTMLVALFPTSAPAASKTTTTSVRKLLGISIPASARVHGATTTPTPTTKPAGTTPAGTTPAGTTPAGGAQPGTVPPTATTPATTAPPTATTPTGTVPSTVPPSHLGTSSTTAVGVARKASPKGTHLSTGALALAVLGALLALGCLVWVLSRWLALEPRWTVSLMHSLREASYRASSTWAEFSDWARLGH